MDHKTTITPSGDEYVLTCTCGIYFIGSAADAERNRDYHERYPRVPFSVAPDQP